VVNIQPARPDHLDEIIAWLRAEDELTGEGFYCNRNVISSLFLEGDGLCAISGESIVGFAVFQMFSEGGNVQIIEVQPLFRGHGIGSVLLLAAVDVLRCRSAHYVDVECTSPAGEALCRRHGFETYTDPKNYRSQWDNPTLRLYLSEWRPAPKSLWE